MNNVARDIRFALRSFGRTPGFAAATILVLGIGIGAVSLMFSTYNTVVLQPLPFPDADQLVWTWATTPNGARNSLSYDDYVDYRDGTDDFQSLGSVGVFGQSWLLTGDDDPRQVMGFNVSANLFSTLGIPPASGRTFIAEDERRGVDDIVILSHSLWVSKYGADPAAVGRTIGVNGRPTEVVGIMPSGFDYPGDTEVWFPLQQSAGYASGRGNNNFYAIGRLRDGVTLEQAQAQMDVVAANIAAADPAIKAGWGIQLQDLHERYFGQAGVSILLLMGIITLVPLVACANVASLFMVRAIARRTELASRLALGATRSRLVRQLVTESLVVAVGGGVVGLALAYGGGEALRHLAPAALPRLDAIAIDGNVMAFTLAAALLTVPLFGVIPAFRGSGVDIAETLKLGGGRGVVGRRLIGGNALVITQVAFSLMLLLASGLLLRGYLGLQSEDMGFETRNTFYSRVALPAFKYDAPERIALTWKELTGRLQSVPGVLAVGAVDRQPISGMGPYNEVWASQRPPATAADKQGATRRFVTDGFFDAMGVPVRAGRAFGLEAEQAGLPVTVINETLARQFFPDEDPLGQTLVLDWDPAVNLTIVGVVGDAKETGPGMDAPATFYLPLWWSPGLNMYLVARTGGTELGSDVWREAVRSVEPGIPDAPVGTIEARLSTSLFASRFRSSLVAVFALVSLLLSAIGLYGVLAYFVRQHRREFGIRLALGATGEEVLRLVFARGMRLVGWGTLIGLGGGILTARLIHAIGWLPGIDPYDPVTYVGVGLCLVLVGLAACAVPAIRALRTNAAEVIRAE